MTREGGTGGRQTAEPRVLLTRGTPFTNAPSDRTDLSEWAAIAPARRALEPLRESCLLSVTPALPVRIHPMLTGERRERRRLVGGVF